MDAASRKALAELKAILKFKNKLVRLEFSSDGSLSSKARRDIKRCLVTGDGTSNSEMFSVLVVAVK